MYNYELYKNIYDNRQYYVSEDKIYDTDLWLISKEKFNKEGKEFNNQLFSDPKNYEYKEILGDLFPYISRYNNNQNIVNEYGNSEYKKVSKTRSIASAKYFDLYFSDTENEFSVLGSYIDDFIKFLGEDREYSSINLEIVHLFKDKIPLYLHRDFLEGIELYIEQLSLKSAYNLLCALFDHVYLIDNSSEFLRLNANKRCMVVIWELLQNIREDDFDVFINSLDFQYSRIEVINSITYWFVNDSERKNIIGRKEKWEDKEKTIISKIIDEDIDLYNDLYYKANNIWSLYRNLKDEEGVFKQYIKRRISRENIFRIINDIMGHSLGTRHTYYIRSSNIEIFFDEDELREYMKDIVPRSSDEEFLMKVYENYLQHPNDVNGFKGLEFDEEKILNI